MAVVLLDGQAGAGVGGGGGGGGVVVAVVVVVVAAGMVEAVMVAPAPAAGEAVALCRSEPCRAWKHRLLRYDVSVELAARFAGMRRTHRTPVVCIVHTPALVLLSRQIWSDSWGSP